MLGGHESPPEICPPRGPLITAKRGVLFFPGHPYLGMCSYGPESNILLWVRVHTLRQPWEDDCG